MIRAVLLAACGLLGSSAGAAPIVTWDAQILVVPASPWMGYASPWGAGKLVRSKDYANGITAQSTTFPSGTEFRWRWPLVPCLGVCGYNHLAWGNYDGSLAQPVKVTPRQVSAIRSLKLDYSFTLRSATGEANVLAELYLTSAAGKHESKMLEVGFLPHAPATTVRWLGTTKPLGTFTDAAGRAWAAQQVGNYVTFTAPDRSDISSARLDFDGALRFLVAKGIAKPGWWVNGLGFGVEPISGAGTMMVNNLSVLSN